MPEEENTPPQSPLPPSGDTPPASPWENPRSDTPPSPAPSPAVPPPIEPSVPPPTEPSGAGSPFPGGPFAGPDTSMPAPFPAAPEKKPPETVPKNPFEAGQRRQRIIAIAGIFLAVILILGGVYWYFYVFNRSGLLILDKGEDITINLNGRAVKTQKEDGGLFIGVSAGNYLLTINKQSYLPFTQNIRLGRGVVDTIRPVFTLLQPVIEQGATTPTIDFVRPSSNQKTIFYLGNNRTIIYRMEIANQIPIPLTSQPLNGITDIDWSWNPDLALITMSDGVYLQEIPYYNFITQTLRKIGGQEMVSPVWDPNNSGRFAFAYYPPSGESSLVFTDKYVSKLDRKANISGIPNPKLVWASDSSVILLLGRSADSSQNNIWLYNTSQGTLKKLTDGGGILDASFSPNGDHILIEKLSTSADNPLATSLFSLDPDTAEVIPLNIAGKVARAAWKDNSSFYLPDITDNNLVLTTVDGTVKHTKIPFTFSNSQNIQGMYYYPSTHTLIFYTGDSIYAVSLALE